MIAEAVICLAMNIYHEARSEPIVGRMAVVEVTLNRVASDEYPNDVCEVVWQNKQFSWTHDGKSDKMKDDYHRKRSLEIANAYIKGGFRSNLTKGATHYHADYVSPYWNKSFDKVTKIGTHIFYK